MFDICREATDSAKVKCSASELLGLYVLLRYIVASRLHPVDELRVQLASFDAACSVLDTILSLKRGTADVSSGAAALQSEMVKHMRLHFAAYGEGHIRPKHHYFEHTKDDMREWRANPSKLSCMGPETFMGRIKRLGQRCHGSTVLQRIPEGLIIGYAVRWEERRRSQRWLVPLT